MLPNNQVRVSTTRVVSQSTSSDITDKFNTAASSETFAFGYEVILMVFAAHPLTTSSL